MKGYLVEYHNDPDTNKYKLKYNLAKDLSLKSKENDSPGLNRPGWEFTYLIETSEYTCIDLNDKIATCYAEIEDEQDWEILMIPVNEFKLLVVGMHST